MRGQGGEEKKEEKNIHRYRNANGTPTDGLRRKIKLTEILPLSPSLLPSAGSRNPNLCFK